MTAFAAHPPRMESDRALVLFDYWASAEPASPWVTTTVILPRSLCWVTTTVILPRIGFVRLLGQCTQAQTCWNQQLWLRGAHKYDDTHKCISQKKFSALKCVVSILTGKIDELSHFHNIMIKNRLIVVFVCCKLTKEYISALVVCCPIPSSPRLIRHKQLLWFIRSRAKPKGILLF